ncbi:MAG TPA: BTAD domain-containing putative transcriptional regulator [Jatrophihabitans sp.]|jgi:DNA-binding SARP family transcriptional activator
MSPHLTVRLLGTLEADVAERAADLGGPRQRAVLALLLVAHGEVVSVDRLIDDLWRGEPPPRAIGALQVYVSNLRRALEPDRAPRMPSSYLVSAAPGYAVRIDADAVDAWRFERLVRAAAEQDAPAAVATLEAALSLWRGAALAEFAHESWAAPEAARLDELRLVARERLVDARVRAEQAGEAVAEAERLVHDLPLREEPWRLLALSQYLAGRQGDALATLRRAREVLSDELGVDPGPALAALERDVRNQAVPVPLAPVRAAAAPAAPVVAPVESGFVGRAPERQALLRAGRTAAPGRPAVALVAAEPGGGKSALLARLHDDLAAGDWEVTIGHCPEDDSRPPAWAWVEALRGLGAPADTVALLDPLLGDQRRDATVVGRFRVHDAVGGWLAGRGRPVAILLDDVHRADFETRSLLTALVERALPEPALFVLAYRPENTAALDDLLATVARFEPLRLRLAGLDDAEIAALVAGVTNKTPTPALVHALAERTEGNPFFLKESARLLASEGELVATSQVPDGVVDVLRRRLARLPEESVSLLRLAAVIGRDVDVAVLTRAAEVDEDRVLDALEAGLISDLLVEPGPGTVRFSHFVVRETLYAGVPQLRRVRWHGRVADAIAELYPNDLVALAHHAARAATPATGQRAAQHCEAAAKLARAAFAFDTEADLWAEARRCLELVPDHDVRPVVEVMCQQVPALIRSAASVEAERVRDEALELALRTGDPLVQADAVACGTIAGLRTNLRGYAEIDHAFIARIEQVLDADLDDRRRCRALITLVRETSQAKDPRCESAYTAGLALARDIGDDQLLGLILVAGTEVFPAELRGAERTALCRELEQVTGRFADPAFEVIIHTMQVADLAMQGDLAAARDHLARSRGLARQFQLQQGTFLANHLEGMVAHMSGDPERALERYADAFGPQLRRGTVDASGGFVLARTTVFYTLGRLPELLDELRGIYENAIPAAGHLYVLALAEAGELDEARRVLDMLPPVLPDFLYTIFHTCQALAAAACGAVEHAARLYELLLPFAGIVAGAGSNGYALTPVARALGRLAATLSRPDDAGAHYAQARDVATACGNKHWLRQVEADLS